MAIFHTERLLVRELEEDDLRDLCDILQDAPTMIAYEHPFSDNEVRDWLDRQRERYRRDGFGLWAALSRSTGEFLGQAGLTLQQANGEWVPEIGYLFKRQHWHHGYATEAAVGCKRYAFDVLGLPRVYSIIRDNNFASQRVAQRNGMTVVGGMVKHYYGIDMPHLIYCVERESR